ncbi:MAG: acetyl-CoA carboxylase carboxyl transferase subunit alpha, partial [Pseudomonadota bacterium]
MMANSLDFEQPIVDLEAKIEELRRVESAGELDLQSEIEKLELKSQKLTREIFSSLSAWQITQLARHPARPHS